MKTITFLKLLIIAMGSSVASIVIRELLSSSGWLGVLIGFVVMFFPLWYVLSEMDRELHRNGRYSEKLKYSIILLLAVFITITVVPIILQGLI